MHRLRFRKFLLVSLLASVGFFAASSAAEANVYCVNDSSPDCTSHPADLQIALDNAAANDDADTVRVGAGTFTAPAGFAYVASGPLEIIGAGKATTKIANWTTTGNSTGLNFQGGPNSSVSNLTIEIPLNADFNGDSGLVLNPDSDAVNIAVTGPLADNARGIRTNGGDVIDSTINLPNGLNENTGISQNASGSLIKNSKITAYFGVVNSSSGPVATVEGSTIDAIIGVSADGGEFTVKDSLIKMQNESGAIGIGAYNTNASGSQITAHIDGVTIIDHSDNTTSSGILAQGDSFNLTPETANVDIRNTVIASSQRPLWIRAGSGGVVNLTADYSAYDFNNVFQENNVGGSPGTINFPSGTGRIDLTGDPGFTNAGTGDYTLLASSPLVDVGDPAAPTPGTTDILGHRRDCNGQPGGAFRRDIGAFEYNDCIDPETSIVGGPGPTTTYPFGFTVASSKGLGSWLCSFDGGTPFSCGPLVTAPDLGLGPHTFSVRAIDQYGNIDQTPATQDYTVVETVIPPTCETNPSLCPDTTAPRVIKLKAPKKTKAKRVKVRFKSNEAGVIFTCRLNKSKAKQCKSPWKTPKLKKGKNVVQVWATDKAGNRSGIKRKTIRRK